MLELGKVEERCDYDMNLYPMSCKAETGLDSDKLPLELRECTPVEIRSLVVEAGSHKAFSGGSLVYGTVNLQPVVISDV